MLVEEIFDLYGVDVIAAGNYNVFLSVYKLVKTLIVLPRHVAGKKPTIL